MPIQKDRKSIISGKDCTEMEFGFLNSMQNWHQDLDGFQCWQGEVDLAIAAD